MALSSLTMSQVAQQVAGNLYCTVYMYSVAYTLQSKLILINTTDTLGACFVKFLQLDFEGVLYKKAELMVGVGILVSLGLK